MSITVADLLKLPSLRNAELVAGHRGINKIVSSISVLESINLSLLDNDYQFNNDEYLGSEMVITGFLNAADDVQLQIQIVRSLASGGEAGLILYYVGIFIKDIDAGLIDTANELDFPLICMPRNQMNLRYSDVISDVMEAVLKDREQENSMAVSLLEQIARLPSHQQTVDNMVKALSSRLKASIILTDEKLQVIHEANWPGGLGELNQAINKKTLPDSFGDPAAFSALGQGLLYRVTLDNPMASNMELFIIRDGVKLTYYELREAADSLRLAVALWSPQRGYAIIPELVNAILKDEPIKMRYLASQMHIDIASINNMCIFTGMKFTESDISQIQDFASKICTTSFSDVFEDELILFTSDFGKIKDIELFLDNLEDILGSDITKTVYTNLADTIDVRKAYLQHKAFLNDAKKSCHCGNIILAAIWNLRNNADYLQETGRKQWYLHFLFCIF